MDVQLALHQAEQLLNEHGLTDWAVTTNSTWVKRLGYCAYRQRLITLNTAYVRLNPWEGEVLDTVLHEIAHALVGPGYSHGPVWQRKARELGATPAACNTRQDLVKPPGPYEIHCAQCKRVIQYYTKRPTWRSASTKRPCPSCGTFIVAYRRTP